MATRTTQNSQLEQAHKVQALKERLRAGIGLEAPDDLAPLAESLARLLPEGDADALRRRFEAWAWAVADVEDTTPADADPEGDAAP